MTTYPIQPLTNGLLFMAVPVFALAVLWLVVRRRAAAYRRKYQGPRLRWALWGSPLLITLLAIVPFYYFLFWEPFYTLTIEPDDTWTLSYHLPGRETRLNPADITTVTVEDDTIPAVIDNNRPRQHLVITTGSGGRYRSALLPREAAQSLLSQLQTRLEQVE
jgi:hypothetical protein